MPPDLRNDRTVRVSDASTLYSEWQKVLASSFFGPRDDSSPAVLFVNDGIAVEMASGFGLPGSLADSVQALIAQDTRTKAFEPILEPARVQSRIRPDEPPQTLPLLAATVIAATRMIGDGKYRSTNFFDRLAQFLTADRGYSQHYRDMLSSSFAPVAQAWRDLDTWLRSRHGRHGASTIVGSQANPWIGYPLSQALMLESDRAAITQFFERAGLTPGSPASGERLAAQIQLWSQGRALLSRQFRHALEDRAGREIVIPLLADMATAWDGVVRESARRRLSRLRLHLDRRLNPTWVAEAISGSDDMIVCGADGAEYRLLRHDEAPYYAGLTDLVFRAEALEDGLRLHGNGIAAVFRPSPIIVFRQDKYLGGWVSAENTEPYEQHLLLVHTTAEAEIDRILETACPRAKKTPDNRLGAQGWVWYQAVVLDEPEALAASGSETARLLRPSSATRPILVGGLKIATSLGGANYLQGGEPDVFLPTAGGDVRSVVVALDGITETLRATGFPFPLSTLDPPLAAGSHTVEADGVTLQFNTRTTSSGLPAAIIADVGISIAGADAGRSSESSETEAIRGAAVPGTSDEFPLIALARRRADRVVTIDHQGNTHTHEAPGAPQWAERMQDANGQLFFEVKISQPGGWLLELTGGRWRVTAVNPAPLDLGSRRLRTWSATVTAAAEGSSHPLWAEYVAAARGASS